MKSIVLVLLFTAAGALAQGQPVATAAAAIGQASRGNGKVPFRAVRQQRLGELLIAPNAIETVQRLQTWPTDKPVPGWHYIRITASVKNVGSHALCTFLYATLKTSFDMESEGMIALDHKSDNRIIQLLPGQELGAEFVFNVKDGVEPLTLIVKQIDRNQGCSRTYPVRITGSLHVQFPVSEIRQNKPGE